MRRKTTRSIVACTAAFKSSEERSLFRSAMFRASTSRQPSISFRNSTSTSEVPRFRLDAAYWSNAPDQTASREKEVPKLPPAVRVFLEAEVQDSAMARLVAGRGANRAIVDGQFLKVGQNGYGKLGVQP